MNGLNEVNTIRKFTTENTTGEDRNLVVIRTLHVHIESVERILAERHQIF